MRSLESGAKGFAAQDVAGMTRSFAYRATAGLMAGGNRSVQRDRLRPLAWLWHSWVAATFLDSYRRSIGPALVPEDGSDFVELLRAFLFEKALYELRYEISHRPDWVGIPLAGLTELIDPEQA